MNNISKLALLVSTIVSTQAFALEQGKFQVDGYGKLGASSQLDADENGQLGNREYKNKDFSIYENTKAGVQLGYGITQNISVHGEVKGFFQGHDAKANIEQLNVQAKYGQFDATLGRMRLPLYMNSLSIDNDFANASFAGPRLFNQEQELSNFDGAKIGITKRLKSGDFNANVMYGIADNRESGIYNGKETIVNKVDVENIIGVDASLVSKFGKFRIAHFQADVGAHDQKELTKMNTTSMGYAYNSGTLFANAEVALDQSDAKNVGDITKGYVTVGTRYNKFVPSITYSQRTQDVINSENNTAKDIELGLAYDVNENIRIKTSYEYVKTKSAGQNLDDNVVNLGVAFKL